MSAADFLKKSKTFRENSVLNSFDPDQADTLFGLIWGHIDCKDFQESANVATITTSTKSYPTDNLQHNSGGIIVASSELSGRKTLIPFITHLIITRIIRIKI